MAQAPTANPQRTPSKPSKQVAPTPPVVESVPRAPGQKQEGTSGWLWGLGAGIVALMSFFLRRILTAKPQAMPTAPQDESARVRRNQHRRGQGRTPASREEQRISETSHQEFMNAPMRPSATDAPAPESDPKQ